MDFKCPELKLKCMREMDDHKKWFDQIIQTCKNVNQLEKTVNSFNSDRRNIYLKYLYKDGEIYNKEIFEIDKKN